MRCPLAGSHLRWNASERPERCPRSKVPPPGSYSPPLSGETLEGKVVLIQFWTFTCINWIRTLPYIREWAQDYRKAGLVVIGVHTPEFDFERHLANVRRETQDLKVQYPVAVDSDSAIWRAL